jgi:hypothetical protein
MVNSSQIGGYLNTYHQNNPNNLRHIGGQNKPTTSYEVCYY